MYTKVKTLVNTKELTQFLALSSIATILPFIIHIQWITGPIINAILIITLLLSGIRSAMLVCLIPSVVALSSGLLPAILAPVVPFIMISNVLFVLIIDALNSKLKSVDRSYWLAIITASSVKFLFLFLSVGVIAKILIKQELLIKVAQMMSWTQFVTAITGGVIAFGFLKFLRRI